ncbi:porin family protein [Sporocytophaga myxococcoides]|uniref:porin family protein n=1 Tax=Sporocytophaga myxococcoides TaxID=153721 RepID=UPI000407F2C4|nr:porin family protein [Sporocytophaga myxococcoides]
MKALLKNRFTGIFLFAVCLLTFRNTIAIAQDIHDPWKITIYYSPEYTSRILSVTSDQPNIKETRKKETGTYGYSLGLNFEKHLNDRFAFGLGGRYSRKGFKTPLTTLSTPVNGNDQAKGSFKAELFEFPVFVNYSYIKKEKISLFVRVGPSFNYLIKAKEKTDYYTSGTLTETSELTRDDANLNNFLMGGNIGTGVQAFISENIGFMLMPQFTYFFTPLRKDVPEKERLYSIGVNGGIILAF